MSAGRVRFVGCGPGAEDLLTLRAVRALQQADVVVWNPLVLDRQTLAAYTRADAELLQWPPATQREIIAVYDRALDEDLCVVRLKGGDPTLCGQMEAELDVLAERGIGYDIVPGVSAVSATAAALGVELATPQSPLAIADAAALGDPPGAIAVLNAGRDARAIQAALLGRGLPATTPCTVAIEISRRDETLVSCPLEELAETVEDLGGGVLTIVVVHTRPAAPDGT